LLLMFFAIQISIFTFTAHKMGGIRRGVYIFYVVLE